MGLTQIEYDFFTKTPRVLADILAELKDLKKEVEQLKAELKAEREKK